MIFKLEPLEGKMLEYSPGQFAFIHLLDEKGKTIVKRPYSIASAPNSPYLEFCIRIVGGELTSRLDKMKKNSIVGIEGPFGHFGYKDEKNAAFIAGGTGISPIMGMLRHIAEKKIKGKFIVFYSTKTRKNIVYGDELASLKKKNPNIKVIITLTREEPEVWSGECGRINEQMVCKYAARVADFDWWICGPMNMIKALKDCLISKGVEPKRLKLEGWG